MNTTFINNKKVHYIFSSKDRKNLQTYFSFKNKNGYMFDSQVDYNNFINNVLDIIIGYFGIYDYVIFPESSASRHFRQMSKYIASQYIEVRKKSLDEIKLELSKQYLMKQEKFSLFKSLDEMNDTFKLNKIKGNQRKRFIDIMFNKIYDYKYLKNKKILLFDDALFSGNTLKALMNKLDSHEITYDTCVIFSKQ